MTSLAALPLRVGARVMGARLRARMHRARARASRTDKVLTRLLAGYAQTDFGRRHGLDPGMPPDAYRAAVPVRAYEGFADDIARMRTGEPGVLWPGICRHFAVSSGTTAGSSKYLPVNDAMLAHFRRAGLQSLLLHTSRAGRADVFGGRHLFLGGATSLQQLTDGDGPALFAGDLSGITAAHMPRWADRLLYEPGQEIAQIEDWPSKIQRIASRTLRRDVRLVAGIPSWLLVLFETLEQQARREGIAWENVRSIWPRLDCLVHGGVPIGPYVQQLRAAIGPGVDFHEVFPASEAFIAAQDGASGDGLRLLDDAGVFYEFLPLDQLGPDGSPMPGARALGVEACEAGSDYALVLSAPSGLARYLIGDVVRLLSVDPPRLIYVGRTRLQLSAFGEHVIEKELTDALDRAAKELGFSVVQFHVAPLFPDTGAGRPRGRHQWWIEIADGTRPPPPQLAEHLDRELRLRNDDYAAKRAGLGLELPDVVLVPRGTFEAWLRERGRWGGQNKVPRCRSDRDVADTLANTAANMPPAG